MPLFFYVARCADESLYAGTCVDLAQREWSKATELGHDVPHVFTGDFFQAPRLFQSIRPIFLLLVDLKQATQCRGSMRITIDQLRKKPLGAVQKTGAHVVFTELEQSPGSLLRLKSLLGNDVLVKSDGTIYFAPSTIQISQSHVRFNRVLVNLGELEKYLDGLIRLFIEQIISKTSSIHFLHFRFTPAQIDGFRNPQARVIVQIGHPNYQHMAAMPDPVRLALVKDFA